MAEPLTIAGILAATGVHTYYHLVGGAVHHRFEHLIERWREASVDPETGLPYNHDLAEASEESLRAALQALVLELAGRLEPRKPWLARLAAFAKEGRLGKAPLTDLAHSPPWDWIEGLRETIAGKGLKRLHETRIFGDEVVRECLLGANPCAVLGRQLAQPILDWARRELRTGQELQVGQEPPEFEDLVRNGWSVRGAHAEPITLAHAYSLFFREHLRANPGVFNVFATEALAGLRRNLDAVGHNLSADLKGLRDQLKDVARNTPSFTVYEAWLTPRLGAINDLLGSVKDELNKVARGQDHLRHQILVAIAAIQFEVARVNTSAAAAFRDVTALLGQVERRLDYLLAGLPITPFRLPDPPTRELQLLEAKHRTVPLLGRDADLDALCAWLESEELVAARPLVGGAGTGKTRLALELLLRVDAALPGWQAGLVTGEALRRFDATKQPADWSWHQPTLLVVDDAQTLALPLAELLRGLTHKRRAGLPALRVLLLERRAGDWFDKLLGEEDSQGPCPVRNLFQPANPVTLATLPPGTLRRRILAETLNRAAALSGTPPPALPPEGKDATFDASLASEDFDQPLNLMMAALAASELGLLPALRRERVDLAEHLAGKELRRVERFAPDPRSETQKRLLRHLAACATMERGFTIDELARAAREETTSLQLQWPDGTGDLATVLRGALPGERLPVAPVEPDFIGEAVILLELAQPDCATGPDRWRSWCLTVQRCARRDARTAPATLVHAFQNFLTRDRHSEALLAATDALIQTGLADSQPNLLFGLEAALPHQTVELRARAAQLTLHLYGRLKTLVEQGRNDLKPELARLANNLSNRLSDAGRRIDALGPAQEAVELRRALAAQNPDAFTAALAMSLTNLANRLSALGRRAEALRTAQEALAAYRALAGQHPDAFQPALAGSLNNLAIGLSELGRRGEALGPAQEAVELYRALAGQNPDAFQSDLALALNNLAIRLSELGRRGEALGPAQEAVGMYRALAGQNPDAFTPGLAMSLTNVANRLGELGRRPEALGPAQEAVERYRVLAARNRDAFAPDLARSLGILGQTLEANERQEEALARFAEGVRLLTPHFQALPEAHAPLMRFLVAGYQRLAQALGQTPDAALLEPVLARLEALRSGV